MPQSSSSAEVRRSITLKRGEVSEYVEGRTQGYRVRFDVIEAVRVAPEIFVYQRKPGTDGPRDEFSNVASPADLEEYPVGEPAPGGRFFRLHYVDLIYRSPELLERQARDLVADVGVLSRTLDQLDVLTEHRITFTGDSCPTDLVGPVVRAVVADRSPTVNDDVTRNFAGGSWWVNSRLGKIFVLASNKAGEAEWVLTSVVDPTKHNFTAARNPTVNDDETYGYTARSFWYNSDEDQLFVCVDAAAGVAYWFGIQQYLKHNFEGTRSPLPGDDADDGYAAGSRWLYRDANEIWTCVDAAVGNAVWIEAGDGYESRENKDMPAKTTANDYDLACDEAIAATPKRNGYVGVCVNGHHVKVGNGSKVADCYFSGDGGVNVRYIATIEAGDKLYWVGTRAGFELNTADRVSFLYETG